MATKKVADMTTLGNLSGDYNLMVHDGSGLKKTPLKNLGISDGAGPHNAWYCDMNLGSAVTDAQWTEIKTGRFRGLPIGGYWTIGNVTYRIAGFNYLKRGGDTEITSNHVVIVPDTNLYSAKMNDTAIVTGGYAGSKMRTTYLASAKTTIKNAFGSSHVLTYRAQLTNAVSNGQPSGGAWFNCDVELMSEAMAYGGPIFAMYDSKMYGWSYIMEKSQLPLFTYRPDLICNRQLSWLRDVDNEPRFSVLGSNGAASSATSSDSIGVRPFFLIY